MPYSLLDLYDFLSSPANKELPQLSHIKVENIHKVLSNLPETRVLIRTYRTEPKSELFHILKTPQAYRNY